MKAAKILQKLWLPSTVTCCAMGVVEAKGNEECDPSRKLVRAKDLPLYPDKKECPTCVNNENPKPSLLYDTVRCSREELWFLMDQFQIAKGELYNCLNDAVKQAEEGLTVLRKEENTLPRAGVIAAGGLTGFIAGLRRGAIRRLFYTAGGAGAMAALCYPKEATNYSETGFKQFKKYLVIAYHFLNGAQTDIEKLDAYIASSPLLPPRSSQPQAQKTPAQKPGAEKPEGQQPPKGETQPKDNHKNSNTNKTPIEKESSSSKSPGPCKTDDKSAKKSTVKPVSTNGGAMSKNNNILKEEVRTCRCIEHMKQPCNGR